MWCFWSIFTLILATLFVLFILANLAIVILTYSTCWYEYANADPKLFDDRFRSRNIRMALSLIAQETCFNVFTLMITLFGMRKSRKLPKERGETPVLLLHGLFNNRASWFCLKAGLRQQGFKNIATINLSCWHNEEVLTELVAKKIDELRHKLGVNKVHLVGHSMGGIIARNYMQIRGGASKVDRCVILGSPHHGSKLAPLSFTSLGKVLIPGSEFLRRLNSAPPPEGVRVTNIYTRKDNMVLPNANTRLDWCEQVELDNIGHTGLIYRKPALEAVYAALKKQD
ncbi:alpha/beta hydrolase fold [Malonomonas rubra DSM 5091]|uniref:Alpha/beta hydrolase fold n=1 Tax=Malonomonas rubra DSM 5091 TaxID=1122189 RepID=A0A1M6M571_MALRU|nr:alpha/beta fold hydrolase [Malonomonas rubra]SHJ78609.1 alpha/beta hydrolase fold [Malonomonas rubra DSM 5091]